MYPGYSSHMIASCFCLRIDSTPEIQTSLTVIHSCDWIIPMPLHIHTLMQPVQEGILSVSTN